MEYDVTRARILLRDLERMNQGFAPAVELFPSPDGGLPLRGTATRAGVMRMGIRLAQAALTAQSHVGICPDGSAGSDGSSTEVVMQVHLIDGTYELFRLFYGRRRFVQGIFFLRAALFEFFDGDGGHDLDASQLRARASGQLGMDAHGYYLVLSDPATFEFANQEPFGTALQVDSGAPAEFQAYADNAGTMVVDLATNTEFVQQLAHGTELRLPAWGTTFGLSGSADAIAALQSCYAQSR